MTRSGLTARSAGQSRPQPRMTPGLNDSVTTSAQRTRSRTTSRPAGRVGSRVTIRFPAFMLWKIDDRSAPGTPSRNGASVRAVSIRRLDSMRTTVAPWSARTRVAEGPASTHVKSRTCTSSSGSMLK